MKKKIVVAILSSSLLLSLPLFSYASLSVPNLTHYFSLDNTLIDSVTHLYLTGQENYVPGIVGSAEKIDVDNNIGHLSFPHNVLPTATSSYSTNFWVKIDRWDDGASLVQENFGETPVGSVTFMLGISLYAPNASTTKLTYQVGKSNGQNATFHGFNNLPLNEWMMITPTLNIEQNTFQVFIHTSSSQYTDSAVGLVGHAGYWNGVSYFGDDEFGQPSFQGTIDEISSFDNDIEGNYIDQLFNNGIGQHLKIDDPNLHSKTIASAGIVLGTIISFDFFRRMFAYRTG